ncbi:MAG: hypothetical protein ABI454_09580 [Sphingomicrobium sp.]
MSAFHPLRALSVGGTLRVMDVDLNIPEALAFLIVWTMLMWAPFFGVAYARRPFGGAWQNYLKVYFGVCALTVGAFVLLAVFQNPTR